MGCGSGGSFVIKLFFMTSNFDFKSLYKLVFSLVLGIGSRAECAQILSKSNLRVDLYQQYHQELFQNSSPEQVEHLNTLALQEIANYNYKTSNNRVAWINHQQASYVHKLMPSHPVVGYAKNRLYDPNGHYGFCFGRALYVHLELLRYGVQKEAIKKAFVIGNLNNGTNWQFHVATIVKGPEKSWWVIDSYLHTVVTLEEWFERMKQVSVDHKLRLYISDPAKLGPSGWEYNIKPGGLFSYNNYFQDLFRYFKLNPVPTQKKFNSP